MSLTGRDLASTAAGAHPVDQGTLPEGDADSLRRQLESELPAYGEWLHSAAADEFLVRVRQGQLTRLTTFLARRAFRLVTVVGNDERELEDRCFKIYYVFDHRRSPLVISAEYSLARNSSDYTSIRRDHPAAEPFERELFDMLGLRPRGRPASPRGLLHDRYPRGLHPLRRDPLGPDAAERVRAHLQAHAAPERHPMRQPRSSGPARAGVVLPVGPIHAGVIEPGLFRFHVDSEAIEDVDIELGFTHRGIERIFQTHMHLLDGWRLAEQVSGDSSAAHALAYCRAAEALTEGDPPAAAELVRVVLLELERIGNHVLDVATLAQDVALEQPAAGIFVIREELQQLHRRVTGHRFLRGAIRPGGVHLPRPFDVDDLRRTLEAQLRRFADSAHSIVARAGFRSRTIGVGVLTAQEAYDLGATGLVARASTPPPEQREPDESRAGDVYARCLTRIAEVAQSHRRIDALLDAWPSVAPRSASALRTRLRVRPENNYTFALGRADGFRGEIVYWIMQDKLNGIYRCKITDPSTVNWPALRRCLLPRTLPDGRMLETVLGDFPLVNKSFNLSYSGNDL
ncbi:MAG: NADH-quinone oxidoreductase subunit C [Kineosporiaceae bacterium]